MDDKKRDKTFSDLFSSINNNLEKEEGKISFNTINKEINKTKNVEQSDSQNIFNKVIENKNSFNDILKEKEEIKNKDEENIFMQYQEEEKEEQPTDEKKEEIKNKDEENIFMQYQEEEKEEQSRDEEKEEIKNKDEENIFMQYQEEEKEEQPRDEEKDKAENKDKIEDILNQNPFFIEEDVKKEKEEKKVNPFFNNKINLVENDKHSNVDKYNKIDTSNSKHFKVKVINKKEPLPKFIIGVISYAIFIWLLLIGIALLVYVADIKIRAAKGDYSSPTYNAYVVLTGSMLPDIKVFDVVVTKKTDPKDLKEGDIITFASSDTRFLNTIITHRIIKKYYDAEKKEYTFQSKGDNNNVADSALVQSNNIYGKVILKIPKLGYLQEFLASKGGWIIAILLPCLAVISYDIVKLAKGLKNKKNIKVQK